MSKAFNTNFIKCVFVAVLFGFLFQLREIAAEYQCPSFDPAQLEQLAMQCLEDPDGLCGDMWANVKVPCTGGVDGLIENVLKKCTEELGAPFDPCGGKTKKAIIDASAKIKCEEGGVLADY
ncbi:unnamed protein product [Bathycoccus prasinos]